MKVKRICFALLPTLLSSCGCSNFNNEKTLVLDATFVFEHTETSEGEKLATLLFNGGYYSFSSEVKIDKPIVAGDQLSITFNGDYEITCQETYPKRCEVDGKIKGFTLKETQIYGIHVDDATIGDIAKSIRSDYLLENEFVILEDGRFTSLDSYDGQDLFLSYNKRKMDENCICPDGYQCEACPVYIKGLYAYNPRPMA